MDDEMRMPGTDILEAVLFAAGDPMHLDELQHVLQTDLLTVQNLLTRLDRELKERHSGLTVRRVAGGVQLSTRPETYVFVERLAQVVDRKLSAPTMETLSIIAFKQPITKQEIEQIRGVRHAERVLAQLVARELITEVGRKNDVVGRPIQYGTTETFLRVFGLKNLDDLPALPEPDVEQLSLPYDGEDSEE